MWLISANFVKCVKSSTGVLSFIAKMAAIVAAVSLRSTIQKSEIHNKMAHIEMDGGMKTYNRQLQY